MKEIGKYLLGFGIGSVILYFVGMEFILLAWIDLWGEGIGWAIRGSMIVVGAILFFVGNAQENNAIGEAQHDE